MSHRHAGAAGGVLRVSDVGFEAAASLLDRHGLRLVRVADGAPIPGSYWGEPEAGVIGCSVHARADTPLHSLLHEACHLLVADPARRASIHTDASDSLEEEDAACYLQIVLADELPGFGRERALADMDAWGYSFRLGSARAWFERDAEDARAFLAARGLLAPALDGTAPHRATMRGQRTGDGMPPRTAARLMMPAPRDIPCEGIA